MDSTAQIDWRTAGLPKRIVLTGFMGSGKTTVGPIVAARLGWKFVDADDVIEAETGASIAEIFAREGEAAFRDREHATISRLAGTTGWCLRWAAAPLSAKPHATCC